MAATNINRVVLTGNLTRDPELRSTPSGTSICGLRIATNTRRKDGQSGEWVDKANYFDVTVAGTTIELGEPTVDATVVTAEILGDMPSADYEARWRVVSSDGHPIDGVVAFTLDAPTAETPSATTPWSPANTKMEG